MITTKKEEYIPVFAHPVLAEKIDNVILGNDPFCREDVIQKQQVLEGKRIRVLYDQAPIGAGEHKIHFLFTSKVHRRDFRELTEEEYTEAAALMQFVVERLQNDTNIHRIYQYHKTGRIQSVKHLHIHLVATVSAEHDADTKTQLLLNMVSWSSKLDEETLKAKVTYYRNLFGTKGNSSI